MSKSKIISLVSLIVLLILVIILLVYPHTKESKIINDTNDYIVSLGYSIDDIEDIKVEHSYFNKLLGYNEWRIQVHFNGIPNNDEKDVNEISFWFSYLNNSIRFEGVSSDPLFNDKDKVIEYSDKFKDGTLLSDNTNE